VETSGGKRISCQRNGQDVGGLKANAKLGPKRWDYLQDWDGEKKFRAERREGFRRLEGNKKSRGSTPEPDSSQETSARDADEMLLREKNKRGVENQVSLGAEKA